MHWRVDTAHSSELAPGFVVACLACDSSCFQPAARTQWESGEELCWLVVAARSVRQSNGIGRSRSGASISVPRWGGKKMSAAMQMIAPRAVLTSGSQVIVQGEPLHLRTMHWRFAVLR